jgi:hypothetical protein
MKKIKTLYWIFTILFGGFMIFSAVPDALNSADAVQLMHDQLGYPLYIIPFIGVAKILGALVLFIPGFARVKEWAYAGLMFDLIGAMYSLLYIGGGIAAGGFMSLIILIGALSYIYHHKKMKAETVTA